MISRAISCAMVLLTPIYDPGFRVANGRLVRSESRRKTLLNFFLRLAATRAFRSMPGGEARPTPAIVIDGVGSGLGRVGSAPRTPKRMGKETQTSRPCVMWETRQRVLCAGGLAGLSHETRALRPFRSLGDLWTSIPNGTESAVSCKSLLPVALSDSFRLQAGLVDCQLRGQGGVWDRGWNRVCGGSHSLGSHRRQPALMCLSAPRLPAATTGSTSPIHVGMATSPETDFVRHPGGLA